MCISSFNKYLVQYKIIPAHKLRPMRAKENIGFDTVTSQFQMNVNKDGDRAAISILFVFLIDYGNAIMMGYIYSGLCMYFLLYLHKFIGRFNHPILMNEVYIMQCSLVKPISISKVGLQIFDFCFSSFSMVNYSIILLLFIIFIKIIKKIIIKKQTFTAWLLKLTRYEYTYHISAQSDIKQFIIQLQDSIQTIKKQTGQAK